MSSNAYDVIIIGGGPVGLGLSIDLALKGKRSLVLERSSHLHSIPKGQNLTQRTGEHFRKWGVSEQIRAASPIPPTYGNAGLVTYGSLLSDYHYDWFERASVRPYYFADNERLPQYEMERVLRMRAADFPEIEFLTGVRAIDVVQEDEGVNVSYLADNTATSVTARADYCVGCDGARSFTRASAGIEQALDHKGPRMVLLVFRSAELDALLKRYPNKTIYNVINPEMNGYWQFLGRVDLDNGWFYHAPVSDDATADTFDYRTHLAEFAGVDFDLDLEHIGFWDLRISLAKTYRAGRIFIAGDAAHSHPPYGGYGVNTGLEDAINLSWKLNAALDGWAGPTLLESYSTERHAVFESVSRDFIGRMIDDFRSFCLKYSPRLDKAAFNTAWEKRANADDVDVTEFFPHYAGSPIVSGAPGARSGAKGEHSMRARAGYHLPPQPLPDGRDLWQLFDGGFVLLDFGGHAETREAFSAEADRRGIPLRIETLESPELCEAYGADTLLVRPDLFVAWTGDGRDANAEAILDRATGRTDR